VKTALTAGTFCRFGFYVSICASRVTWRLQQLQLYLYGKQVDVSCWCIKIYISINLLMLRLPQSTYLHHKYSRSFIPSMLMVVYVFPVFTTTVGIGFISTKSSSLFFTQVIIYNLDP
jgi:hypothetical protein